MSAQLHKPAALIIGSTGQIGRKVVNQLDGTPEVNIRLTSRRPEEVSRPRSEGRDVVYFDLDNTKTFGAALAGIDRLFLVTGYTVAMVAQSKNLVDAAKKAGVRNIVHLGVFAEWDCADQRLSNQSLPRLFQIFPT